MYEVNIKYKREAPFLLPMIETIICKRFEKEGIWLEFETEDGELIIISPNNTMRVSIKRC